MSELWTPRGSHKSQKKRKWYITYNPLTDPDIKAAYPHASQNTSSSDAYHDGAGLRVLVSEEVHPPDNRRWKHVSMSREDRLPSWEDVLAVKEEFIGEEEEAYQVLPRASEYVNVHPNVLHIWHCMSGDIMPR